MRSKRANGTAERRPLRHCPTVTPTVDAADDAEQARRALYQRDAADGVLDRYLRLRDPPTEEPSLVPVRRRGRRRIAIVLVIVAFGVGCLTTGIAASVLHLQQLSLRQIPMSANPSTAAEQRELLASLFSNPYPKSLSNYFDRFPSSRPAGLSAVSVSYRGVGRQVIDLRPAALQGPVRVVVAVTCTGGGSAWISGTITGRPAVRRQFHCGSIWSGTVTVPRGGSMTAVTIEVAPSAAFIVEGSRARR